MFKHVCDHRLFPILPREFSQAARSAFLYSALFDAADRSVDAALLDIHTRRTAMAYNKQAHYPDASHSYCTNAFRYS